MVRRSLAQLWVPGLAGLLVRQLELRLALLLPERRPRLRLTKARKLVNQ